MGVEHSRPGVDRAKLEQAQRLIAEAFGEDSAEALQLSASRFARWQEAALSAPREAYEADKVRLFDAPAESHVGLITIKATAYSACEHHYAPAWLKATIGYVPDKTFIGYSKIVKMFRYFACRYTMDERLCNDFVNEFIARVSPLGVGLVLRGKHFCVISRGGLESDFPTVSALWGSVKDDEQIRREFYQHCYSSWETGS
ncbi:GTP cyclohydrolase I [Micromonospora sp. NPDC006766]|uniref:GTP cyclohydrolase I n=1 Tax=Micromonospora sp. NPDC006766 TaxID=3154778 RepID=UPI0033D2D7D3